MRELVNVLVGKVESLADERGNDTAKMIALEHRMELLGDSGVCWAYLFR